MDDTMVAQVRRFNRTVTQRVGALNDSYLSRGRPLGQARVLWEIGPDGCDVRELRARLQLDSGYVSRLLRSLESAGLVTVGPSPDDKRLRTARLTRAGRTERAALDRRSDDLARSLLEPLDEGDRGRLVSAMVQVERLLTGAMVQFEVVDPESAVAQHCLNEYYDELNRRFDTGFDPAASVLVPVSEMRAPSGLFVVGTLHDQPIACGAARFHSRQPAYLKRMWVSPTVRGLGVGRRLLADLEDRCAALGHRRVHLETNRALTEAIAMYRSAGYREVPAFNDETYAHHWFEKRVGARLRPR